MTGPTGNENVLTHGTRVDGAGESSPALDGSGLCTSCHKNNATEPHCCPYQAEINNNEDAEYCTCCHDCEHECAMDT